MKQWLLNWLLKDITRFEIINHNNKNYEIGRLITHNKARFLSFDGEWEFTNSLQDNNKTLKIFI